jgi:hypothetical protein
MSTRAVAEKGTLAPGSDVRRRYVLRFALLGTCASPDESLPAFAQARSDDARCRQVRQLTFHRVCHVPRHTGQLPARRLASPSRTEERRSGVVTRADAEDCSADATLLSFLGRVTSQSLSRTVEKSNGPARSAIPDRRRRRVASSASCAALSMHEALISAAWQPSFVSD